MNRFTLDFTFWSKILPASNFTTISGLVMCPEVTFRYCISNFDWSFPHMEVPSHQAERLSIVKTTSKMSDTTGNYFKTIYLVCLLTNSLAV